MDGKNITILEQSHIIGLLKTYLYIMDIVESLRVTVKQAGKK